MADLTVDEAAVGVVCARLRELAGEVAALPVAGRLDEVASALPGSRCAVAVGCTGLQWARVVRELGGAANGAAAVLQAAAAALVEVDRRLADADRPVSRRPMSIDR